MAAYQRGDVAAFDELVTRHERPLYAFLRRFVGDAATAEDLLQEVFLRVVNAAGGWKDDAKVATWIYTIARNLCTDQARRAVHRKALSLDAPARAPGEDGSTGTRGDHIAAGQTAGDGISGGDATAGGLPGQAAQGEAAAMNRQLGGQIDRAVNLLPEDQREVFLMREVMDMPFADIARAVGASEATVKSRMRYALEKLRQALTDFRDGESAKVKGVGIHSTGRIT
ncbi:MAG: sigma-70 family RNA polymerase sigma factor [Deltaproteobacteria bacterium]|nr:sigma-70 family RNA polymerase sigma factor [Deltaproteobacteria bacterium]